MARYKLMDRHLSKLLPVSFSEQILAGTFEYAVNWLVDHQIDRSVFDPRYSNDEAGASAYDPSGLLKIVLLGYARGLTSSRSIDRACRENVVFMALSGDSAPHFTTIAAFIARMPGEITSVFRDVLLVCDEQGLIGRELFAVDGCKLPSNASRTWSGTKAELAKKAQKMEKAIGYLLDTHRRQDSGQNQATLVVRECQQIETLSRNSRKLREWLAVNPEKTNRRGQALKSNVTDPESATMKTRHGVVQGYTGVAAVDAKAQVVVQAEAFGTGQENGLLPAVLESVRKHFDYDPAQRTCRCPAGKPLKLSTGNAIIKGRRGVSFEGTKQICGSCPLRTHCLRKPGVSAYRQVTFFDGTKTRETHPHTKAMKARIDTPRRTPALQPTSGHRRTGRRPTCIRIGSDDSPCDPEERSMPSGSSSAWSTTCRSCKDMRRDVELGKPKRPRYGQAQSSLRLGRANRHDPPARDHQHDQTCAEGLQKYLR